jgi:Flp pilus assembly protein TadG
MWQKQKGETLIMQTFKSSVMGRVFGLGSNAPTARALQRLKSFNNDQSGNVGMIFGGTLLVLVGTIGGAVDYGRWLNARSQTQYALDAATLAAGKVLRDGGDAVTAVKAATAYYEAMKSKLNYNDTVTFAAKNNNTVVESSGAASVQTPFLSLIGVSELAVVSAAATPTSVCVGPNCGSTSNTGSNIEISMMLDTTGSMSGDKLVALKTAAKDLIDVVIWSDQTQYTSRVAIAPFSDSVNVGQYFKAVTGVNPNLASGTYSYPASCYTTVATTSKKGKVTYTKTLVPSCQNNPLYAAYTCVVERAGVNEYTGAVPVGTGVAPLPRQSLTSSVLSSTNNTMIPWNQSTSTCNEETMIQPLTDDKQLLKNQIDSMVAANSTAGALGTAWAWYMLSPEWSTIFTGDAAPGSYADLTILDANKQPKLRKIAILMTDGAYNTHQGAQSTTVPAKAKALCAAMKAKGIMVYTIGFQLDNDATAISTLTDCASSHTIENGQSVRNFYNVDSPTALQSAFRDIALQISKLRLSH